MLLRQQRVFEKLAQAQVSHLRRDLFVCMFWRGRLVSLCTYRLLETDSRGREEELLQIIVAWVISKLFACLLQDLCHIFARNDFDSMLSHGAVYYLNVGGHGSWFSIASFDVLRFQGFPRMIPRTIEAPDLQASKIRSCASCFLSASLDYLSGCGRGGVLIQAQSPDLERRISSQ